MGFILTGLLYGLCGFFSETLTGNWLILMYFASSFFGQCGPNCTTFLIPAEVFPTEVRTTCHGISAAAGKLGALISSIGFNYASMKGMFFVSSACSLIAFLITTLTIPESSTLNLHALDERWRMAQDGCVDMYVGVANSIEHLSLVEKWTLKSKSKAPPGTNSDGVMT